MKGIWIGMTDTPRKQVLDQLEQLVHEERRHLLTIAEAISSERLIPEKRVEWQQTNVEMGMQQ